MAAEQQQERVYTIPLRKAFLRAPKYKRTKRSVNEIRYFLQKHLKSTDIRIGKNLNDKLWENGGKNPPPRIKVKTLKNKDNMVLVELPEFDFNIAKEEKETKEKKVEAEIPKEEKKVDLSLEKNIKKQAKESQKKPKEDKA